MVYIHACLIFLFGDETILMIENKEETQPHKTLLLWNPNLLLYTKFKVQTTIDS